MKAFVHAADLSASEAVRAIEGEFALVGYARYLKVLEVLAGADNQVAKMTWEAWAVQLAAQPDQANEFLMFCYRQELLEIVDDDGETLTVSCPALVLHQPAAPPAPPSDDTLFTHPEQWAEWFIADLSYPRKIANNTEHSRMFARWCASRVTVGDMSEAVQRTIAQGTGLNIEALHGHLHALRAQRIKDAHQCF